MAPDPQDPGRRICPDCQRPEVRCLCRHLRGVPQVDNHTEVVILQHPRERHHPLGTAPLLRLGLRRVRLEVAWDMRARPALPPGAALLYPTATATPLESLAPEQRPPALLLLDGTWKHARKLLQHNPWLEALPACHLTPAEPGRYRIRGEPDRSGLATVEAACQALALLEPDLVPALGRLMGAFDEMIDQQVEAISSQRAGARQRRRYPTPDPLHRRLERQLERVGLVHVEAVGADVVQVAAARPANDEAMDLLIQPPPGQPIDPEHLRMMGLQSELLRGVPGRQEVAARLAAFLGPAPLLSAWSARSLKLAQDLLGARCAPTGAVMLKAAYHNLGRGGGALEEIVAREGIAPPLPCGRGRAGRQLALALAVLRWIVTPASRWSTLGP